MQGYGQGGQPPGYPAGPPSGGNPPQDWQVQPPGQPPAPGGYGPPAAPAPQPYGQPGGYAPQPAPQPMGYAPPAAPGAGHYEFNDSENQTVNKLASRLLVAGIMSIVFGAISLLGGLVSLFGNSPGSAILGFPGSIAMIVIGGMFCSASGSFKQITRTQGNDMGHLMQALGKMTTAATVQIIGYIVATVLFLVGIVVVVFLMAAIMALFAAA